MIWGLLGSMESCVLANLGSFLRAVCMTLSFSRLLTRLLVHNWCWRFWAQGELKFGGKAKYFCLRQSPMWGRWCVHITLCVLICKHSYSNMYTHFPALLPSLLMIMQGLCWESIWRRQFNQTQMTQMQRTLHYTPLQLWTLPGTTDIENLIYNWIVFPPIIDLFCCCTRPNTKVEGQPPCISSGLWG